MASIFYMKNKNKKREFFALSFYFVKNIKNNVKIEIQNIFNPIPPEVLASVGVRSQKLGKFYEK